MTLLASLLHAALTRMGIPVVSVSIGDDADRSTWEITYGEEATDDQKTLGAAIMATFDPSVATANGVRLIVTMENDSGQSTPIDGPNGEKLSSVDPSVEHILIPEPRPGYVMVPLYAGVQCDSDRDLVVWQALLNPVKHVVPADTTTEPVFHPADTPGVEIVWQDQENIRNAVCGPSMRLTRDALVGGEYFLSVPVFPIVHGLNILSSWSYATGGSAIRSRSVCVEVPMASFDWSRLSACTGPFPRLTTI